MNLNINNKKTNQTMMNIEPLTVNTHKYNRFDVEGNILNINRIKYKWKDLMKFDNISDVFLNKRIQKFLTLEKQYNKPTSIINKHYISSNTIEYSEQKLLMAVCLPCYDEEWSEMSGTIRSLVKNILVHRKRPDKTHELHVIIFMIQDGWSKASKTLKKGITEEFGCPDERDITNEFKRNDEQIVIVVPKDEIYYPCYMNNLEEKEYTGTTFYPVFITKSQNSQKHNSHLIFFSLCAVLKPDLVFLTDCGTIYNSDCLHKLVEYLYKKKNKVIAVTARQRIMNEKTRKEVRDYPSWWKKKYTNCCLENIKNFYWWISPAPLQGFEFESTFILNTAMFNVLGALPVLPGPCQLIWWKHLETETGNNEKSVLDMYFHHLNVDVRKSGILKTNTLLAEDRILSFAMVLRTLNLSTVWVSGATFSYEPMTTWVQLLGQRRRWVNGTIATYIFYLLDDKGQDEFAMSGLGDSRTLQSLWGVQLYQSLLQILSPAFFSIAVYESSILTYRKFPFLYSYSYRFIDKSMIVAGGYFGFYILWVLTSMFFGKRSNCVNKTFYNISMEIIYWFFAFINSIVSIFIFYNIFASTNANFFTGPAIYILIVIWVIPFILALMLSFSSAFLYILYGIPFMLHIIHYVAFIPSYAFARMHDLSWGNRDSNAFSESKKVEWSFFWITLKANVILIILNFLILVGYVSLITYFGRSLYTFIPIFVLLFMPTIVQIGFALIYIFNMISKNIVKNYKNSVSLKNEETKSTISAII
jgi:cellulose synthase/poly-beta-1,6-N-acetylglucosamine synthase-like glycosyltransferase